MTVGDPQLEQVRMGALVSHEQRDDVQSKVDFLLRNGCEPLCGAALDKLEVWATVRAAGAFYPPTLLYCADPLTHQAVHGTEAFGPVATLMPYADTEQAIALALLGQGNWQDRW